MGALPPPSGEATPGKGKGLLSWEEPPPERDCGRYDGGLRYLIGGKLRSWDGPSQEVFSPIHTRIDGVLKRRSLGPCALLSPETAKESVAAAVKAFDKGRGAWPTATPAERILAMSRFLDRMEAKRFQVARLLCWEIGKPWADSLQEFDRTVAYGRDTLEALKELDRNSSRFAMDGGFLAQIRRSPFGVALCMGPFNYPLNETFTTLLPALVMGNSVILKLPRVGMLCNMPLLGAFAESFPPGVVNVILGEGSKIVGPIMESGEVDLLAFIGSAKVANILNQKHPRPNRLRSVLGLGAKNAAIVLKDADLSNATKECAAGALTFNGQRCTALKIIFVQQPLAEKFLAGLCAEIAKLKSGAPFSDAVALTPLAEDGAVERMSAYVADAVERGARVVNPGGGETDRTYFHPAVVYPVRPGMKLYDEEQFGPIVAVASFNDPNEVLEYLAASPFGQQASLFGKDPSVVGPLVDALVNQVCRVNLNSQCRRGPDTYPFGGRKDSAEGTLSVTDALRVFSIRTLVAAKQSPEAADLIQEIVRGRHSRFLNTDYLF